ncbi:MAG: hypothetical protein AMXMBFR64_60530 [Myxococcales bacterium]
MDLTGELYSFWLALSFVWGAIWGSFLNVVIHRLPHGHSVVRPPSHCPRCSATLRWWHNVPILSWVALRARCAFCGAPISPRYPLVELLTAVLSLATFMLAVRMVPDAALGDVLAVWVLRFTFVALLVAITFIDLDLRIIPHELSVGGLVVGLGVSPFIGSFTGVDLATSALGAALGGGIIFLIIQVYWLVRRREGMGGGDFVMMAMLGAWLGYEAVVFVLFASSLQGTVAAIVLYVAGVGRGGAERAAGGQAGEGDVDVEGDVDGEGDVDVEGAAGDPAPEGFRTMEIPFGPFLALAALEWMYFESFIRDAVVGWLGL